MSKRHQASRRKSYGRRQHEVHERTSRRSRESFEVAVELDDDAVDLDEPVYYGYAGRAGRLGLSHAS